MAMSCYFMIAWPLHHLHGKGVDVVMLQSFMLAKSLSSSHLQVALHDYTRQDTALRQKQQQKKHRNISNGDLWDASILQAQLVQKHKSCKKHGTYADGQHLYAGHLALGDCEILCSLSW